MDAPALTHLETLNCLACHEREGRGGPEQNRLAYFTGDHDLGDTGRYPPPLTNAGRKFQPNWLADAIGGKRSIRPYLHTQMPVFGHSVRGLSEILIVEDTRISNHDLPEGDIEAGRKLLGTQGGLNCITCHGWDDRRSLGIKGLDLSSLSERLRADWLHDYLINPASHRPNTLMPSFWPAGIASNQEILQGDTRSQIAAIYAFAENGSGLPEGFPEENATTYEIIPTKRPVVQRSFMEGVGTHALLVGYPEGIHFAIDGKTGQPAMMWKGRFFDAYKTWFSRYPAFEKPLGKEIIHWAHPDDSGESQYRGYRFGPDGIPEFLVELDGAVMYERLQPVTIDSGEQAAKRTIRYSREAQWNDTRLKHPIGANVTEIEDNDPMTRIFIYQW